MFLPWCDVFGYTELLASLKIVYIIFKEVNTQIPGEGMIPCLRSSPRYVSAWHRDVGRFRTTTALHFYSGSSPCASVSSACCLKKFVIRTRLFLPFFFFFLLHNKNTGCHKNLHTLQENVRQHHGRAHHNHGSGSSVVKAVDAISEGREFKPQHYQPATVGRALSKPSTSLRCVKWNKM